jgi:hypothetical protein
MTAKIPNRELLEVPDALKEDFGTLKPTHVLRDPFALPDPPPLLPAYHNVNLDVPDIPNSDEDDLGGDNGGDNGDVTPVGDKVEGCDVEVDEDDLMSADFWNGYEWTLPEMIMPPSPSRPLSPEIPAPADPSPTSPELSPEPPPRVLRARGRGARGRGRGRARTARARPAQPVVVPLPAFSEAHKITTPGRKYDVE